MLEVRHVTEDGELHRRLVWLTFFRLAVVSVLFASTLILSYGSSSELPQDLAGHLLGVAVAGFLVTLGFSLLLWRGRHLVAIAYSEITVDVLLAGALAFITGGASLFSFMFILAVVNAALLLFQRGAVLAATLSSATYALMRLALNERWINPPAAFLAPAHTPTASLLFSVFVNLSAFFLVAALASYLAGQVKKKGEQLSARELDYETLADLHRAILASIPTGIATVDRQGDVTYVNRAGMEICRAWGATHPVGRVEQLLPGFVRAALGPVTRREMEIPLPGEGSRWLGLTVSELGGPDGLPAGLVVVFQDLTELRRLEEEARRNERLAAVGKLAAGLAHELRNPLASMSGAVQMLTGQARADADERRLAEIVASETARLNRLVTDFLGFARPSPHNPARLDLAALTADSLDVLTHGPAFEGIEVARALEPVEVVADGAQLRQVILNLLLNAAQACAGKGKVDVKVFPREGLAVLQVEDGGPGIAAEHLPHIFDPFFTTKPGGTGLGLSTVHALVGANEGQVHAENRDEGGARFVVTLARATSLALAPQGAPNGAGLAGSMDLEEAG